MHTQAHKSLFFRSCILSCQNGWPYLWGVRPLLRLPQTEPIQSGAGGREEELLMTDERWKLIPICGEGKTVDGKTWGLMSWSRERNKGRKDAVGGCGAESACSDPAPEWFSEYTREWPFNSKPTFSLVRAHTITRGVHMWKPWLIFCFCLQKFW